MTKRYRLQEVLLFPYEWVATVNKRVISAGKDLGKVEEEAKKKTGRDPAVMFVESGSHIY